MPREPCGQSMRNYRWLVPVSARPGNEMVMESAVNGGAQAIVTFNLCDFGLAPNAFGIDAPLPRDALRRLIK